MYYIQKYICIGHAKILVDYLSFPFFFFFFGLFSIRTHSHIYSLFWLRLYGTAILSHSWWSKIFISCSIETVPFNTYRLQKLNVHGAHTQVCAKFYPHYFLLPFFLASLLHVLVIFFFVLTTLFHSYFNNNLANDLVGWLDLSCDTLMMMVMVVFGSSWWNTFSMLILYRRHYIEFRLLPDRV